MRDYIKMHKYSDQYKVEIDELTFAPYIEVLGKRVWVEPLSDLTKFANSEQIKEYIIAQHGEDVYNALTKEV